MKKLILLIIALIIALTLLIAKERTGEKTEEKIDIGCVEYVKITVLIDNNPWKDLEAPWGISIYIETNTCKILFDTGPNPEALRKNSEKLGVNLEEIDAVFISHGHADHYGGLPLIAAIKPGVKVYIPSHAGNLAKYVESLNLTPVKIAGFTKLFNGVASTGELYGPPYEQSLIIKTRKGLIVVTGCSHPGVDEILKKTVELTNDKIYMVIGGFHLTGASEERLEEIVKTILQLKVEKVYPIHCSGENARKYFKQKLKEKYGDGHVGLTITITSTRL